MTTSEIARRRLDNQQITNPKFDEPGEVVAWLGAVQAQDYLGSLWAVGLRTRNAVEADIERAIAERKIIRTWPMRGTLHYVAAADVKWMLALLTPRIVAGSAQRILRQLGIDEAAVTRCKKLLVKALQGGRQRTRAALYELLEADGIATGGSRGINLLSRLAQDGLICFGAREGKQQTFALLDEWLPPARSLTRDEALAEAARRYFTSRGPATLQDFTWWTGLTAAEAKEGLELVRPELTQESLNGQPYLWAPSSPSVKSRSSGACLLPVYDEYTVAYKDRSAVLDPSYASRKNYGYGIFNPMIIINGQVVGSWKRELKKGAVVITPDLFEKLSSTESRACAEAAGRYGRFLEADVHITSKAIGDEERTRKSRK